MPDGLLELIAVDLDYRVRTTTIEVWSTSDCVFIYREEYVFVLYAKYICTEKRFRRIFVTSCKNVFANSSAHHTVLPRRENNRKCS